MEEMGIAVAAGFLGLLLGLLIGFGFLVNLRCSYNELAVASKKMRLQHADEVEKISAKYCALADKYQEEVKDLYVRLKDMHGRYINVLTVAERRSQTLTGAILRAVNEYQDASLSEQDASLSEDVAFSKRLYTEDCEKAEAFFKRRDNEHGNGGQDNGTE